MAERIGLGRKALELLKEVAYCDPEHIPKHNDAAIKEILMQVRLHDEAIQNLYSRVIEATGGEEADNWGDFPAEACSVVVHNEAILRNKRLLLLYMKERTDMVQQLRWQHGRQLPESLEENLSASEVSFFRQYDRCLVGYNRAVSLDLTTDTEPPLAGTSSMVSVIVREGDGRYITTSHGDLWLQPNVVHWIPKEDADQLVRDGVVSRISDTRALG